jgi:hypothetical protein
MEDVDPCELPFSVAPHVVLLDQADQGPEMRSPFVDAGEAPPSTIAAPIDFPDTGAIVALIDRDDSHHDVLRQVFEEDPGAWVLPWAVLPEVDHIVSSRLGPPVGKAFRSDLSQGLYSVEWGERGHHPSPGAG